MTVATIIARARQLAEIEGAAYFSTAEEYASLNESYRDVYEKILDSDDDYFLEDWAFAMAALTPDPIQARAFTIALPVDFYRLRVLQYQSGQTFRTIYKFAPQEEPQSGVSPSYRLRGEYLKLILPALGSFTNFRGYYYPVPTVYTLGTEDITFPPQLRPEILAYQIAIDARRKQQGDYAQLAERRDEIFAGFVEAIGKRDNWQAETVNNVYNSTDSPWR